jgi:DNA modification methylase
VFASDAERVVVENVQRKSREAEKMMEQIVAYLADARAARKAADYTRDLAEGDGWALHQGDCIDVLPEISDESVGLSVFSPPFPGMYVYSDSDRDMGNTSDLREFAAHMRWLARDLLRVTMPGRTCAIHLTQLPAQKVRDGYVGLKDMRGAVIRTMQRAGWVYYGEVAIDKDPQVKAIRTKDQGLLFKSLAKDSAVMHMALADYVVQFRKPGANIEPIRAGTSERYKNDGWITAEEWIEWAAPVWYRASKDYPGGIRETDVLNVQQARDDRDERHICPLQLGVIERCVKLWSAPGDLVLSPFAGIGSEGVVSLQLGRRFLGVELKPSYFDVAKRNLGNAVAQQSLLSELA